MMKFSIKNANIIKKVQKGHGRLEVREIWTSSYMNSYFARDWYGIAQIFMIRKTLIEKGEKKIIVRYGITSLPQKKANAQTILQIKQDHWKIENRSHYRRDVTLAEDASQVRINGAPAVLAAINTVILSLMDFIGVTNLAKQTRYYNAKPRKAIRLLFGRLSR
jgi:predicted transposase YbfD/YdcC